MQKLYRGIPVHGVQFNNESYDLEPHFLFDLVAIWIEDSWKRKKQDVSNPFKK